ncbi:hypothetical protein ACHHYP_20758 [Achlya hypogyna]|uniref:Uncharacterized protein n=1 Tax=Achlya hypogyna TaxID=1202772 RepID=A0A1V9YBU6_ACHHY|nr:hypothetical protein ACHHYP_20758 [Achlya hypogyna]
MAWLSACVCSSLKTCHVPRFAAGSNEKTNAFNKAGCTAFYVYSNDLRIGMGLHSESHLRQFELEQIQTDFATKFWSKHQDAPLSHIINVDETEIYYDMPPRRTCAEASRQKLIRQKSILTN